MGRRMWEEGGDRDFFALGAVAMMSERKGVLDLKKTRQAERAWDDSSRMLEHFERSERKKCVLD